MCEKVTTHGDKCDSGDVTPPKMKPPGIKSIILLDAMPGFGAVQPINTLKMPNITAKTT